VIKEDDVCVVIKLITGEQLMAIFEGEDEKFVKIDYPITIRTTIIPELNKESVTAAPYCPFSETTSFVLEKSHIVYIKKMHKQFIANYKSFLKSYDEIVFHKAPSADDFDEEGFDDLEELTIEEIQRRLDLLEAIASAPVVEEGDEDKRVFVKGNDTKH
jgi:hypothetical protein